MSALHVLVTQRLPTAADEEKVHWEALNSCFEVRDLRISKTPISEPLVKKQSLLKSQVTMASFGKFAQVRRTIRDKVADFNVLEMDSTAAAAQMTLLDHSLFAQIPMDEFLFKRFTKPEQCPSFTEFAAKFEQWGLWVASEILSRCDESEFLCIIVSLNHALHCSESLPVSERT